MSPTAAVSGDGEKDLIGDEHRIGRMQPTPSQYGDLVERLCEVWCDPTGNIRHEAAAAITTLQSDYDAVQEAYSRCQSRNEELETLIRKPGNALYQQVAALQSDVAYWCNMAEFNQSALAALQSQLEPAVPEAIPLQAAVELGFGIEQGRVFRYRDSRGILWAVPTFVEALRFEGEEIEGPLHEDE
jgi:hypothetical protein